MRNIRAPCRPPDFGLMKTSNGQAPGGKLIWNDMADDELLLDDDDAFNSNSNQLFPFHFGRVLHKILTSAIGRWLSERVRERRSRQVDTWRSKTVGQMDVGGRM